MPGRRLWGGITLTKCPSWVTKGDQVPIVWVIKCPSWVIKDDQVPNVGDQVPNVSDQVPNVSDQVPNVGWARLLW